MIKVSLDASGMRDLMMKLSHLDFMAGQKVMLRAARYAMKPVYKDAMSYLEPHRRTGELELSLRYAGRKGDFGLVIASGGLVVTRRRIAGEEVQVEFGEDSGEYGTVRPKRTVDAHWRWHFLELGTSHHQPYPYLRPAFNQNRQLVVDRVREYLDKTVERIKAGGKP